jgi:hypothetical protein
MSVYVSISTLCLSVAATLLMADSPPAKPVNDAYCGVRCVAKLFDRFSIYSLKPDDEVFDMVVKDIKRSTGNDFTNGCTLGELETVLEKHGLIADPIRIQTPEQLPRMYPSSSPILLHLSRGLDTPEQTPESIGHFVVVFAADRQDVRVFDGQVFDRSVSYEELANRWTGNALTTKLPRTWKEFYEQEIKTLVSARRLTTIGLGLGLFVASFLAARWRYRWQS